MTLRPARIHDFDERALDGEATEVATFALGCFWGPDARFGSLDGVVRTRVGYAGGTKPDPSYHALGDHTEVFQVDYDPAVVSYTDLLDRVFRAHDPYSQSRKTQYQHVVFTASAAQRDALEAFLAAADLDPDAIETRIEALSRFFPAEDYHQKHSLRARPPLLGPFEEAGYDDEAIRESPAAAALNGYAAGETVGVADELGLTDNETAPSR
ncbi:peptide-methionine (S)-S-oxide reductase MsrA [Halorientalis sp.]|uniref:peptide-methionine (S)-S-oxide reductase MsrA n=1 Tax=Halorientalis sp. TaxID=1931229 RepID=UPI0026381E77|nr:peptide-methionine (S)-S-oxide reductase [Halorientalis sp.]